MSGLGAFPDEDELRVADALEEAAKARDGLRDEKAAEETAEVEDEIDDGRRAVERATNVVVADDRGGVVAAINEAVTPMVVIADASPPNCKGCAEPTRASQSQNPFKPSWVRVPFRAAQQYLLSVSLSQFCIPIFWSYIS